MYSKDNEPEPASPGLGLGLGAFLRLLVMMTIQPRLGLLFHFAICTLINCYCTVFKAVKYVTVSFCTAFKFKTVCY
jgi:hypothetical protein